VRLKRTQFPLARCRDRAQWASLLRHFCFLGFDLRRRSSASVTPRSCAPLPAPAQPVRALAYRGKSASLDSIWRMLIAGDCRASWRTAATVFILKAPNAWGKPSMRSALCSPQDFQPMRRPKFWFQDRPRRRGACSRRGARASWGPAKFWELEFAWRFRARVRSQCAAAGAQSFEASVGRERSQ
jgi:hypothetical protein